MSSWRKWYNRRLSEGKCVCCGDGAPDADSGFVICAECRKKRKDFRENRKSLCGRCLNAVPEHGKRFCVVCKNKTRADRTALRNHVFAAYGGHCVCCGEDELVFLTIDHVHNDGATHRREVGLGDAFFKWLKSHGFPSGFQILCRNCNWAKFREGECPHKRKAMVA